MGLNTACIIRNDFLHQLRDDPKLGEKIWGAVVSRGRGEYHGQGFDVLPSCHADYIQVVAIGGNTIRRLGYGGDYKADDIEILRNLASRMGYRIVKIKERTAA
jgi:hypothetical protein